MKNLAIITARYGSKRIPKKNIKDFCGKPILAYSIEAALKSNIFDEVMVSTDAEEIANIAKEYGAKVPFFRSAETSNDFATTRDVLDEVLNKYEELGKHFNNYCCIYPTAPFVNAERLIDAYKRFIGSDAKSLTSVVKYSYPPQRGFVIENGELKYINPEFINTRSQDLEPIFHDAGQFYFYVNCVDVSNKKNIAYILPDIEVQDIDTIEDWNIAEIKYKLINKI